MNDLSASLSQLATQINSEHQAAETALRSGLEHARNAGRLLLEAKSQCRHGEWTPWLESNVRFSVRTAQAYMRVAERWTELEAKAQPVALLTFKDAVQLLAEPSADVKAEDPDLSTDDESPIIREDLLLPRFPLKSDKRYLAVSKDGSECVEIMLADRNALNSADPLLSIYPEWCWVGFYRDVDTDNSYVEYMPGPIPADREPLTILLLDIFRLDIFEFGAITEWHEEARPDPTPWYITAPGKPGRSLRR